MRLELNLKDWHWCLWQFFCFWCDKTEYLSSHQFTQSLSYTKSFQFCTELQEGLFRTNLFIHVEHQQLCEINVMCVSWQPYRKIMSSHLSVISNRLLQMCHCTADEYSFESILYVSVEWCRQGFSLLLKVVLQRPLIYLLEKKWHKKSTVCDVLMKTFSLVWWFEKQGEVELVVQWFLFRMVTAFMFWKGPRDHTRD